MRALVWITLTVASWGLIWAIVTSLLLLLGWLFSELPGSICAIDTEC